MTPTNKQPNILLIVLDTLRRDRLSTYGHHRETSPTFDAFAEDATLFEHAIAAAQWTIPSHASMFTGLYPSTHQVTQGGSQLSGVHPTLAEIMNGGGYHTVGFCNNPLVGVLNNGLQRGFEHFYNYAGTVPNRPFDTGKNALSRAFRKHFRRFARPIENRFAQSDTLFRLSLHPMIVPVWTNFINFKGSTSSTIDDVMAYWSQHSAGGADRPLFAFVNLMGAHLPYNPPQDYVDRIAPRLRHDRHAYRFMRRFNTDAARWASPPDSPLQDWERAALDDFYDAEVAHQDYHLGRLLDYLRASGALDDTLVMICADHGEGHGDHDFFGHGFVVYQELVHVPLVIHYPASFPTGKRIPTNVSTRRIFHTVLDAAGIAPPLDEADPNANIAALTLRRATNGHSDSENGLVFAEAFPPTTFLNVVQHRSPALIQRLRLNQIRRGVYQESYKLAVVADKVEGLYNVASDPAETHNLADHSAPVVAELQQKIGAFVAAAEGQRTSADGFGDLDDSVLDNLRALGYIE